MKDEGLLNHFLMFTGVITHPIAIFASETAVAISIVYSYLPFMILPLVNGLASQNADLAEAARDLGVFRMAAFWTITFR